MDIKLSKGRRLLFIIVLFLTNFGWMADSAIVPAAANLYETFNDKLNLVNFILSGPSLVGVTSALLCAKLIQHINKKTLLILSYGLLTVCSIFGIAVVNVYYILLMRVLVGFGYGMINVVGVTYLAEAYIDEQKRSAMMGAFTAFIAICSIILSLIAGILAARNWQSVFYTYWINLPILALIILFIPRSSAALKSDADTYKTSKKESLKITRLVALCLALLALTMIYMIIFYQLALYVSENKIGDPSTTGILTALGTVGSTCTCLIFGLTYKKMKRFSIIPSYILLSAGFLLLYLVPSLYMAVISSIMMGAAYGNSLSYYLMRSTVIVPPASIPLAISFTSAACGIGSFFSTYVAMALMNSIGSGTITSIMPYLAVALTGGAVLSIILSIRNIAHPSEY